MFQRLGMTEILLIGIVALLIFGPAKLPQLGRSLGDGIREFKGAMKVLHEDEAAAPERKE